MYTFPLNRLRTSLQVKRYLGTVHIYYSTACSCRENQYCAELPRVDDVAADDVTDKSSAAFVLVVAVDTHRVA